MVTPRHWVGGGAGRTVLLPREHCGGPRRKPWDIWWAGDALSECSGDSEEQPDWESVWPRSDTSTGATAPCQAENNSLGKGERAALEVAGWLSPVSLGKSAVPSGWREAKMPSGGR